MNAPGRLRQIASVLSRYGFDDLAARLGFLPLCSTIVSRLRGGRSPEQPGAAERVRMVITDLGPTFVKLGQMLATRPDLLPADFIREFKKLHDDVPPFSFDQVRQVFESQTGRQLTDVFASLDEVPLAAASIGQVHAGTLLDGRRVVLKVQRPGIPGQVDADLRMLRWLAVLLERRVPMFARMNARAVVEEFRRNLLQELDFQVEVANQIRYADQFADDQTLFVPRPITEYCTSQVIVMDFVDGFKVTDTESIKAAGIDLKTVIENGMRIILRSIFEFGFFHADPHPGNFFVMKDGVVALLDYGTVASVDSRRIDEMTSFMLAVAASDVDMLINVLVDMDVISDDTDVRILRADLSSLMGQWRGAALRDVRMDAFMAGVIDAARRHSVRIPADLLMVGKAIAIIEGIGWEVCPDFRPVEFIQPYLQKVAVDRMLDADKQARSLARVGMEAVGLLKEAPYDIRRILGRIRRGEHQIIIRNVGDADAFRLRGVLVNRAVFAFLFCTFFFGSAFMIGSGDYTRHAFGVLSAVLSGMAFIGFVWSMFSFRGGRR